MYVLGKDNSAVKTALLLELNSCFTRIWREYVTQGSPEQKLFLKKMIDEIRECVENSKPE